jgi:superfamily I DNA/RNA helicase
MSKKSILGSVPIAPTTKQPPHVIVDAKAGTGKTTTIVKGLCAMRGIDPGIIPSPQQKAVWEQIALSKDARTVCLVAFNKPIALELQRRVPSGCDAMTMHSMGLKACTKAFGRLEIDGDRVYTLIEKISGTNVRVLRKEKFPMLAATEKLVGLCKMTLTDPTADALDELVGKYDIDLDEYRREVYEYVPQVLELSKDPSNGKCLDFNDMIWLPVIHKLNVTKYDLLLCDERQDFNRCQQALAMMACHRMICVGDKNQAIYGFAGADSESMERAEKELGETERGCVILPLTVTRRCGRAIVKEAQQYVPEFEAHESNCDGLVGKQYLSAKPCKCKKTCSSKGSEAEGVVLDCPICHGTGKFTYMDVVKDGDMILCRTNAPLVSQCFKFLKLGRKATIQGRDVGKGLISLVKKTKATSVEDLIAKLDDWRANEERKEQAKRIPSESKLQSIRDKADCLICFTAGCHRVEDVLARIDAIFTDTRDIPGIKLSSIHRAKGLESDRVFILRGKGMMGYPIEKMTGSERQQELNLRYVSVTRAIKELYYVVD